MKYLDKVVFFFIFNALLHDKIGVPRIKEIIQLAVTDTQTNIRTYVYNRTLQSTKKEYETKTDQFLGVSAKLRKASVRLVTSFFLSFRLCVCPFAWNSAPTGRILMKFDMCVSFVKFFKKLQVSSTADKKNGQFTFRPL